jgi:hypothetical protein
MWLTCFEIQKEETSLHRLFAASAAGLAKHMHATSAVVLVETDT